MTQAPAPTKAATKSSLRPAKDERPDRKYSILLAAEKLFAERGFHAVSIRDIADEAQVPLALVGYYFGQKHELYHAIFEHWSSTIDERLAALQEALQSPQAGDRLQRAVEAFIEPVIRLRASPEGEYYALLMSRGLSQQTSGDDAVIREFFDPLANAFIDGLHGILSKEFAGCTRGQIAWCYQFLLGSLLHHITDVRVERLSGGQSKANAPQAQAMLVEFIVGGIRAALPLPLPKKSTPPTKASTTPTRRRRHP